MRFSLLAIVVALTVSHMSLSACLTQGQNCSNTADCCITLRALERLLLRVHRVS
ncbi:hypothetical protein BDR06DRAFT_958110 [Suillus hirtellus]|nr:hypothetical protein BDR06DRAFT_958110 [Suillus hirtellus]